MDEEIINDEADYADDGDEVNDDEADGEDGEDPAHGNGHQHLHLAALVHQELQRVRLLAQTILHVDLSLVESESRDHNAGL